MTLTMIHSNPAHIADGTVRVDRKFLTGMQNYVANLSVPIASVHPQMGPLAGQPAFLMLAPLGPPFRWRHSQYEKLR